MARNEQGELTSIWTPANVITSVRICFIPVFMLLAVLSRDAMGALTHPAFAIGACVLYILLSLTDKLDGSLARKRNEITDFGKFLDPIADKVLVSTAFILLLTKAWVFTGFLGNWALIVAGCGVALILAREIIISGFRMVAADAGVVIAADKFGKYKTVFQDASVVVLLISAGITELDAGTAAQVVNYIGLVLFAVAIVLTVLSGINYIVKNIGILKK